MKKNFLLLLFSLLLVTGCDVNYNLTIDANNFDEKITLSFLKQNTSYDEVLVFYNDKTPVSVDPDENKFYNTSLNDTGDYYNLNYNYNHNIDSIKNSYFIRNCYPDFKVDMNDNELVLSSGSNFLCLNGQDGLKADKVKINIVTKLKVLSHNADTTHNNTYTWNLDSSNYNLKSINMKIQRDSVLNQLKEKNEASYMLGILFLLIVIVGFLVFIYVKYKAKKNNDF